MAALKKTSSPDLELLQKKAFTNFNGLAVLETTCGEQMFQENMEEVKQARSEEQVENESCSQFLDLLCDEDELREHGEFSKKWKRRMDPNTNEEEAENSISSYCEHKKEVECLDAESFEEREKRERNNPMKEREMMTMFPLLPSGRVNLITHKKMQQFSLLSVRDDTISFQSERGVLISVDNIEPLIRKDGPKLFIAMGSGVYRTAIESAVN